MKTQADVTLSEEFNRNWSEITDRTYMFDRHLKYSSLLSGVKKKTMIDFMTSLISQKNENRRKLSVQVVGRDVIATEALDDNPDDLVYEIRYQNKDTKNFVGDISEFKKSLRFYPLSKIDS